MGTRAPDGLPNEQLAALGVEIWGVASNLFGIKNNQL